MRHPRWDPAELELGELETALDARGVEPFHARQLYQWIYKRGVTDIDRMTDLSLALRATTAICRRQRWWTISALSMALGSLPWSSPTRDASRPFLSLTHHR